MRYLSLLLLTTLLACSAPVPETQIGTVQATATPKTAPYLPPHLGEPAMLIFSKTKGWRHDGGIAGGNLYAYRLATANGLKTLTTEDADHFNPETLAKFDVIFLSSATGRFLDAVQTAAFRDWLEAGGGVIAVHGAGDGSGADDGMWWYQEAMIGPLFIGHPAAPQFQDAALNVLAPQHPVMAGLPARFTLNDEWYSFDGVPGPEFTILAGLDETTYSPVNNKYGDVSDLRMGEGAQNHPIIWSRCIGMGRVVYAAMGHEPEAFDAPEYQKILENSLSWVRKETDPDGSLGCKAN